jgi:hypothetical protein
VENLAEKIFLPALESVLSWALRIGRLILQAGTHGPGGGKPVG